MLSLRSLSRQPARHLTFIRHSLCMKYESRWPFMCIEHSMIAMGPESENSSWSRAASAGCRTPDYPQPMKKAMTQRDQHANDKWTSNYSIKCLMVALLVVSAPILVTSWHGSARLRRAHLRIPPYISVGGTGSQVGRPALASNMFFFHP